MRTINDQLSDIVSGKMTVDQVLAEGVDSYAIKYYEPTAIDCTAYYALHRAYMALEDAKKKPVLKFVEVEMVKCRCGHTIPRSMVMAASMGSSCPDCYDRMS